MDQGDNFNKKRFKYKNGLRLVYKNVFDPLYKFIIEELKEARNFKPTTVLDIGAWNGFFTRRLKHIWPDAHYTCIEAGPKHEYELKKCADKVYISVLGDSNRDCIIYHNKVGYTKGASLFNKTEYEDKRQMETLESVVGKDATYDLIKQDVQGAELIIMQGSPEIFKRAKYIMLEVKLDEEKKIDDYMKQLGFINNQVIPKDNIKTEVDNLYWAG